MPFCFLQICFRLFRLLLLYHHPRLCRFLDQYQLQPELYATPWFLTLFSNSLDLERLYEVGADGGVAPTIISDHIHTLARLKQCWSQCSKHTLAVCCW